MPQTPTAEEESQFLDALARRDAASVSSKLALWPTWAQVVRPCRQPTVHYLLQNGTGSPDGKTIECIELLVAHGGTLDTRDESGGCVLHSVVSPRAGGSSGGDIFAEDAAPVLEFLLRHPMRPSLHAVNHLGLNAMDHACRVGNVPAIDTLLAASHRADPVVSDAAADAAWEEPLVGFPVGLIMGAQLRGGTYAFQFHNLTRIAAKHGRTSVLQYLLTFTIPAPLVARLSLLEGNTSAVQAMQLAGPERVRLWSLFPLATDPAEEWLRLGSPLQAACSAYSAAAADADAVLACASFMIEYTREAHITREEVEAEATRVSERYHEHVLPKTPAAVYTLLRAQDSAGRCALHYAADGRVDGSTALLRLLLSVDGSLLQATDRGGRTPLDAALRGKKQKNAEWLVAQHGVASLGMGTCIRGSGVR